MRPELIRATELLRSSSKAQVNEALELLQDTVYSFSMKVCGHPEDAEDTAQEVLIRSLPHLGKIKNAKAMSVWLYTVAKNRCVRMRRKGRHSPNRVLSLDELMPDDSELQRLLEDTGPDPEARAATREQTEHLHSAILGIPPQYRLVLVLHDLEELDTEQVAQILNVTPTTVRVRLHRARLALRRALAHPDARTVSDHAHVPDRRSRKCKAVFANLSEYLDGRLKAADTKQMQKHIKSCAPCVAFVQDLRRVVDRCRGSESSCTAEVRARLRGLLVNERHRITALLSKKTASML